MARAKRNPVSNSASRSKMKKEVREDISYNVTVSVKRSGLFKLLEKVGLLKPRIYDLGTFDFSSFSEFSVKGLFDKTNTIEVIFVKYLN